MDNKIKKIQTAEEAIEIPKDGFVISATGASAEFLQNNFSLFILHKQNLFQYLQ